MGSAGLSSASSSTGAQGRALLPPNMATLFPAWPSSDGEKAPRRQSLVSREERLSALEQSPAFKCIPLFTSEAGSCCAVRAISLPLPPQW